MPGPAPRLFSDRFTRLLAAAPASRDPAAGRGYLAVASGAVSERLLQCIWFDQLLKPDVLRTTDGRRVTILAPGFWNLEAGPDFFRAEVRFGDSPPVRGDVEVHLRSEDWNAHGHGQDSRYNDTILHVVLANRTRSRFVTTQDGRTVPQLELKQALVSSLDDLRAQLDTDEYPFASRVNVGACHRGGLTGDSKAFWDLISLAGETRLLLKARRAAMLGDDWDHVCYATLLRALGFRPFADACLTLAERVPYARLVACIRDLDESAGIETCEACLLGMAGLLPQEPAAIADTDARTRARRLTDLWQAQRSCFGDEPLSPAVWNGAAVRPANRPARRLAAAARLIAMSASSGLFAWLRDAVMGEPGPRQAWRRLERAVAVRDDAFWGRRADLAGAPWTEPRALVGQARARVLVVDAIVPSLLAAARATRDTALEARLYALTQGAPPQALNGKLRLALYRMQGAADQWPRAGRSALHAQGLLHVLQEWCLERPTCEGCAVRALLESPTVWEIEKGPRHL